VPFIEKGVAQVIFSLHIGQLHQPETTAGLDALQVGQVVRAGQATQGQVQSHAGVLIPLELATELFQVWSRGHPGAPGKAYPGLRCRGVEIVQSSDDDF